MKWLQGAWHDGTRWLYALWPVSMLFRGLATLRRRWLQGSARRLGRQPLIVVGNISVGGAGKTSLLMALAQELQGHGFSPGVISRGHGGRNAVFPLSVTADSDPAICGDEPVLIAANTRCPVVIDPDRCRALQKLLADHAVDLVLADDGLQHYRLHRDLEIAMVDGSRMFGNGLCLPAGPLREPPQRLREVDLVVVNGAPVAPLDLPVPVFQAEMQALALVNLHNGEERQFHGRPFAADSTVQVVSAIGNPDRFFALMQKLPHRLARIDFPDHHPFSAKDFASGRIDPQQPIVMTEKDAVKCRKFATANFWVLRATMTFPPALLEALLGKLGQVSPRT